jgi:hypothetical protein
MAWEKQGNLFDDVMTGIWLFEYPFLCGKLAPYQLHCT